MNRNFKSLISYNSILKILNNDEQELINLLNSYEGFIRHYSSRFYSGNDGKIHKEFDEDKCQYIKIKLILSMKPFSI